MDRRLLVLALGMFALGTDSFVVAGVLPQVSHGFNVSVGAAGQLATIYAFTYALLAPTIAALASGVSRKRLLLSGLFVFVIANLGTAAAPTFAIALMTRALAGVGAAMFAPTATGAAAMLVPPERRGFALSVVVAGLTTSTALGSPIGAVIGGLGDWRWTMVFVAALAVGAALGVGSLLSDVPMPPSVTLSQRLAPLADSRIGLTLATTLLSMGGSFTLYAYFAVVFDRAIAGSALLTGVLLVLWGAAGTFANLLAGRLIDSIGNRTVIVLMLTVLVIDLALTPWAGARFSTAAVAITVFGAASWGILVPQQHRLVTLAPNSAPVVLGLNTSCSYLGLTTAGVIGAAGINMLGVHNLGVIGAFLNLCALVVSEFASRRIIASRTTARVGSTAPV